MVLDPLGDVASFHRLERCMHGLLRDVRDTRCYSQDHLGKAALASPCRATTPRLRYWREDAGQGECRTIALPQTSTWAVVSGCWAQNNAAPLCTSAPQSLSNSRGTTPVWWLNASSQSSACSLGRESSCSPNRNSHIWPPLGEGARSSVGNTLDTIRSVDDAPRNPIPASNTRSSKIRISPRLCE